VTQRMPWTMTHQTRVTLENAGFRPVLRWERDGEVLKTDEALSKVRIALREKTLAARQAAETEE